MEPSRARSSHRAGSGVANYGGGAAVEGGARQGCLRGGRAPAFPAGGGPGSWPGVCGPAGVDIISKRGKGPGLSNSRAALQQTHTERGFRACGPLSGGGDLLLPKQQPRGVLLRTNHTGSDRLLPPHSHPGLGTAGLKPQLAGARSRPCLIFLRAGRGRRLSPAPRVQGLPPPHPHSGAICPAVSQPGNTRRRPACTELFPSRLWFLPGPVYLGFVTQVARTSVF